MNYDNEKWKPIVGYNGLYEISNMGRVKSLRREVKGGWGTSRWMEEKILSLSGGKIKYKVANLSKGGIVKSKAIHKLVAESFLGHVPDGHDIVVDHINGDKHDNRLENLQLMSQRDNLVRAWNVVCPNCGYKH